MEGWEQGRKERREQGSKEGMKEVSCCLKLTPSRVTISFGKKVYGKWPQNLAFSPGS
jgi:hypothetical protein